MRLAVSADWHFGSRVRDDRHLHSLLAAIEAEQPDAVLVLGDLVDWHRPDELAYLFHELTRVPCPVAVVFGNHDIWVQDDSDVRTDDSWAALHRFCTLARQSGVHPLDWEPLQLGPVAICGTGAWYDYSLGEPLWSDEQYMTKRLGGIVCQDVHYARWTMPDADVCALLGNRLEAQLQRVPVGVEPVVVTHMAALRGSLPQSNVLATRFLNAFWGSYRLSEVMNRHSVRLHLHGHIHHLDGQQIPGSARDHHSRLESYNACFYEDRPFLLCERDAEGAWSVRAAMP